MLSYANWIFWFSSLQKKCVPSCMPMVSLMQGWVTHGCSDRVEAKPEELMWHWSASHAVKSQTGICTSEVVCQESHWSLLLYCSTFYPTFSSLPFPFFLSYFLFSALFVSFLTLSMQWWQGLFGFPGVWIWWPLKLQGNTNFQYVMRTETFGSWITKQQEEEAVYLNSQWLPENQQLGYVQFKKVEGSLLED